MSKKHISLALLLYACCSACTFAQPANVIDKKERFYFRLIAVLADKHYTFKDVLRDSSLPFQQADKINVAGLDYIWQRVTVTNRSQYDEQCFIVPKPGTDYTLYSYNEEEAKWDSTYGGYNVYTPIGYSGMLPCLFKGNKTITFYIKQQVSRINQSPYQLSTSIYVEKAAYFNKANSAKYNRWMATVVVVLAFFCYNAYLYYMFKDKAYLYYLLILIGSIIYISAIGNNLNHITNYRFSIAKLQPNGLCQYFSFDILTSHLGIILTLTGFIQYTRHYLQTALRQPFWDKLLRVMLLLVIAVNVITDMAQLFQCTNAYASIAAWSNVLNFAIVIAMLVTGIISLQRRYKPAKYYLIAQTLPLFLIAALVISLWQSSSFNALSSWLPHIAIIVQALTLAIALVARVNLIKAELAAKQSEHQQIAAQMAIEKERNVRLEEKIGYDKREIAAAKQIKLLMKELHHRVKNNLQMVASLLSLQSFKIKDTVAASAVKEGQHRIEAMSLIHQRLYITENITEVNIKEYVTDLVSSLMQAYGYQSDNFSLELTVDNELMEVDKAIPMSLIINELVTNAFKYAYADSSNPALTIAITKDATDIHLLISDNGKGLDVRAWQQDNSSFGKELVATFTKQLRGTLAVTVSNGTSFNIHFPNQLNDEHDD